MDKKFGMRFHKIDVLNLSDDNGLFVSAAANLTENTFLEHFTSAARHFYSEYYLAMKLV